MDANTIHPVRNANFQKGMRRIGDDRDMEVLRFELEKEDIMKFKPLYESLYLYFREEGWTHPLTHDDKIEDLYWERWIPSGAKEQHIWWRMAKDVTPYVRYFIELNYQTLNVTKAEVGYKNKKVNAEKIDFIVRGFFYLQWDYDDKFKNSLAWKFKKAFFNKIYREDMEKHKEMLRLFGERTKAFIKAYFEMAGQSPEVSYFPPMGYKDQ